MARNRPSRRSPVSLNEMARAAAEMLLYGYQTHDIELELSLADGLPAVQADADQIGQVVMNLLVNAQQALAGFDGARRVRVETGVQPAAAEREACGLAAGARTTAPGSTAACARACSSPSSPPRPRARAPASGSPSRARWRATTAATSSSSRGPTAAAPASCSACRWSPPRRRARRARARPSPAPAPQARLLVVDDEADLAALMRDMLESAGYDVATAESGAIALELLDTARFDAIVSDLRMPDMDGAGLWREVSARHPELARRMLFVTGDTLSPDARQFLKASKGLSLDKPFSKADLLARVAALLE